MTTPSAGMQIPEGERESYARGQHLRGADAQNADRAKAEIVRIKPMGPSQCMYMHCFYAASIFVVHLRRQIALASVPVPVGRTVVLHRVCVALCLYFE